MQVMEFFLDVPVIAFQVMNNAKKHLTLISGDEAVSVDDQEEAEHLVDKTSLS